LVALWKKIAFTSIFGAKGFGVFSMDTEGKNIKQLTFNGNQIGAVFPI